MKLRERGKKNEWDSKKGMTCRKKKSEHDRKGAISSHSELFLIKTAASMLIPASIKPSLWSKVMASSCYLHAYKGTLETEIVLLQPAVYS